VIGFLLACLVVSGGWWWFQEGAFPGSEPRNVEQAVERARMEAEWRSNALEFLWKYFTLETDASPWTKPFQVVSHSFLQVRIGVFLLHFFCIATLSSFIAGAKGQVFSGLVVIAGVLGGCGCACFVRGDWSIVVSGQDGAASACAVSGLFLPGQMFKLPVRVWAAAFGAGSWLISSPATGHPLFYGGGALGLAVLLAWSVGRRIARRR
jgi:hypothetical protein